MSENMFFVFYQTFYQLFVVNGFEVFSITLCSLILLGFFSGKLDFPPSRLGIQIDDMNAKLDSMFNLIQKNQNQ